MGGTGGFLVRGFQASDFPLLMAGTSQTGWEHLNPQERRYTTQADVAARVQGLLRQALSLPTTVCLIGELGGTPVAYELLIYQPDEVSGVRTMHKLDGWVHPELRGRGINRIMHEAGEAYCRQMGISRMTGLIATHNTASIRATDKTGFETERLLRAKWLT